MSKKMDNLELWNFFDKKVKIIDVDGYIWIGKVYGYNSKEDNDGIESIDVDVDADGNSKFHKSALYELTTDDIVEIEEIN